MRAGIDQKDRAEASDLEDLTAPRPSDLSQIEIPELALPKGGGALKGIDETFRVAPATGTASLQIPLPITPGRSGLSPQVGLSYSSGAGNGTFGLGWTLDLPKIARRTDKAIPRYRDGTDTFVSGGEEIVPWLTEQGPGNWTVDERMEGALRIRRYRPRTAGAFSRIERIDPPAGGTFWKVTSGANEVTFFGRTEASRIADPDDPARIFEWLPDLTYDDRGNCIVYNYKPEDTADMPQSSAEANRLSGRAGFSNRYLKRVRYGNMVPFFPDPATPFAVPAPDPSFHFELVFDYGEHDPAAPTPDEVPGQPWPYRADATSSYRQGFEVRTARLCRRVLMFHSFPDEFFGTDTLVRALELEHAPSSINGSGQSEVTYLTAARMAGFLRRGDGSYAREALPPLTMEYQPADWQHDIQTVQGDLPAGLTSGYKLFDFAGEGISGVLREEAASWFYHPNLGPDPEQGAEARFGPVAAVLKKPNVTGLDAAIALQSLDGDGTRQAVLNTRGEAGYFDLGEDAFSGAFVAFNGQPPLDLSDPNVRAIDLAGDGRLSLVMAEETALLWARSMGRQGYLVPERVTSPRDPEDGPRVVFAEAEQSVFLADMSGDGLTDLVEIRNGSIAYWPNLGYGRFGARVRMDGAPQFTSRDQFAPSRVRLADVTGTGASDLLYLGAGGVQAWLNMSGNGWSGAQDLGRLPPETHLTQVTVTDLTGNGTPCLVWSSSLPGDAGQSLRYIDLMGGRKPHVLSAYANGMGLRTELSYRSATQFYLEDARAGQPWVTRLPIPVQVVAAQTVTDAITGARFETRWRYAHGVYDPVEKEFRGFGRVDQTDSAAYTEWLRDAAGTGLDQTEAQFQAPMLTRSWYDLGLFDQDAGLRQGMAQEYWQAAYMQAFPGDPAPAPDAMLPQSPVAANSDILDPGIVDRMTPADHRAAARATRGRPLRTEVFALDGDPQDADDLRRRMRPYTVTMGEAHPLLIQPAQGGHPPVFMPIQTETLSISTERDPGDPRIEHVLVLETDAQGNVLEQAEVAYGRDPAAAAQALDAIRNAASDFAGLDEAGQRALALDDALDRAEARQTRRFLTITRSEYTNDVTSPAAWRRRQLCGSEVFEITGLAPGGALYSIADLQGALTDAVTNEIAFETDPGFAVPERRRTEAMRALFRDTDLTSPLPYGQMAAHGMPHESFVLALTPALVTSIYGNRIADPAATLSGGGYAQMAGAPDWWIPSGQTILRDAGESLATVRARFLQPIGFRSGLGAVTRVGYRGASALLMNEALSPVGNRTRIEDFDFRTLSPALVRDANDNLSAALYDELGRLRATASLGKDLDQDGTAELDLADDLTGNSLETQVLQADLDTLFTSADSIVLEPAARSLLARASVVYCHDDHAFIDRGAPCGTATVSRERHFSDDPAGPIRTSLAYTDGGGGVVMTKEQADPGIARQGQVLGNGDFVVTEVDTAALNPPTLRWIGNGRVVRNNKGHAVRKYEPYFSVTPRYEDAAELVETGVSAVVTYDPLGRPIRTDMPDGTFSQDRLGIWQRASFDAGDTVLESRWHAERVGHLIDAELQAAGRDPVAEEAAARNSEAYADTPKIIFSDALGRGILMLGHDGFDAGGGALFSPTSVVLDVEGNTREIHDARGNLPALHRHDLAGRRLMTDLNDAGARHDLPRSNGAPFFGWDGRGHVVRSVLDAAERPVATEVTGGDGPQPLAHRVLHVAYGEGQPNDRRDNLRGRAFARWDGAGRETMPRYDRFGNPLRLERRFAIDYRSTPDWSGDLDAPLEAESFVTEVDYDALGRPVENRAPDGTRSRPFFGADGNLERVEVEEPGQAPEVIVSQIAHDARGQRMGLRLGNGTGVTYGYASDTFRLITVQAEKANGDLAQDLLLTHDAMGNPSEARNRAVPVVFFDNQKIEGVSRFEYDARYRLVRAEGREHAGQAIVFGIQDNWRDLAAAIGHQPGDQMAWRTYVQQVRYDAAGNIRQFSHAAQGGSFTRDYVYAAGSNRLERTQVGAQQFPLGHHPVDGLVTDMPHLSRLDYNHEDQMVATARQAAGQGKPETTYYVYDHQGARVRKVTENAAQPGQIPARRDERFYLGSLEIHRVHTGPDAGLERRSLAVSDGVGRAALIDRRNGVNDGTPARITRYQLSDHRGGAVMEMDGAGRTLNYEEYHPFGTTAYRATDNSLPVAARRYRYARERDEESGLYHQGERYYAPWLCRWCAPDPEGLVDGLNLYAYVGGNPVRMVDPTGTSSGSFWPDFGKAKKDILNAISNIEQHATTSSKNIGRDKARIDIDEPKAVSQGGAWDDPANKQFMESNTNRNTKNALTDANPRTPKPQISLADAKAKGPKSFFEAATEMLERPFSEIKELEEITNDAKSSMRNLDRSDRKMANSINKSIRKRIRNAATEGTKLVSEALEKVGIDPKSLSQGKAPGHVTAVDGTTKPATSPKPSVPDAPSSATKAAAKTGDAVEAASDAAKKSTRLLKATAKLGKAGRHFLAAVPFVGIAVGHASAAHAASQGDYTSAALDEAGFIPVAGDLLDAGRGGIAVGEAITELDPEIERTAMKTGAAAESAAKWVGLDDDTAVYVGAGGAALGAVAEVSKYAVPGYGAYKAFTSIFD